MFDGGVLINVLGRLQVRKDSGNNEYLLKSAIWQDTINYSIKAGLSHCDKKVIKILCFKA